jgi:hypothetical protein
VRFHDDARFVAIDAGRKGSGQSDKAAIDQFPGVFAEIPNIAVLVLSEPIQRVFRQDAVEINDVMHLNAFHSLNHFRLVRDDKFIVLETIHCLAFVNQRPPGRQWKIGIVYH